MKVSCELIFIIQNNSRVGVTENLYVYVDIDIQYNLRITLC